MGTDENIKLPMFDLYHLIHENGQNFLRLHVPHPTELTNVLVTIRVKVYSYL